MIMAKKQCWWGILTLVVAYSPTSSAFPISAHSNRHGVRSNSASTTHPTQRNGAEADMGRTTVRSTTALRATLWNDSIYVNNLRSVASLTIATVAGYQADHSSRLAAGSGILVSLTFTAVLAQCNIAPSTHVLYDQSWTHVLPASLVFLLLSLSIPEKDASPSKTDALAIISIQRLAVPFGIASIGSVLGCIIAFLSNRIVGALSVTEAQTAAACLAASFVGGSVNLFATASMVSTTTNMAHLVTSMAAADLLVMGIYFSCLGLLLRSTRLRNWFGETDTMVSAINEETTGPLETIITSRKVRGNEGPRLVAWTVAPTLAYMVVRLARLVEAMLAPLIPGTACAVIVALSPLTRWIPCNTNAYWKAVRELSAPLSQYCFLWLFASIGMSADLGAALRDGPSCVVFSLVALVVHLVVTIVGSASLRRFHQFQDIGLADVLVVSNAAIGGPATAAAFCGQVDTASAERKRGLTVAATVWGVVGYGIGTTIGVTLYRLLPRFV